MKHSITLLLIILQCLFSQSAGRDYPQYKNIQQELQQGWNTWNTRSVLQHVLLPHGLSINIAFKQHYFLEEQYLREALIGRRGENVEQIRPGPHTYDGSFTQLDIQWEELNARIRTAHIDDDLVILIEPNTLPNNRIKVIIESGILWNRKGTLHRNKDHLLSRTSGVLTKVYTTGAIVDDDPYLDINTPYLAVWLEGPIGVSTGKSRTIEEIKNAILIQEENLKAKAAEFGGLAEAFIAVQAGLAWNLIYEPKHDRVVSTVGRLWNEEYGGYCLFGWDNFFMAYMTGLSSRELAFANVIEHLHGKTEKGFIPNDNRGNGSGCVHR